ncbi:MAG: hypothetical protein ACRC2T_05290 [Thermoguttaceae bacterium]
MKYTPIRSISQFSIFIFLLVCVTPGCQPGNKWGKIYKVEGTVTYEGEPAQLMEVTFMPQAGGRPSTGVTNKEGKFKMQYTIRQEGVQSGEHNVNLTIPVGSTGQNEASHKVVEIMQNRKEPYRVTVEKNEKNLIIDFKASDLNE